jgi:hypothetical protein
MNYELAKNIQVSGSVRHCLEMLQTAANDSNIIYKVSIGPSPFKKDFTHETIRSQRSSGRPSQETIPIQLMWRSTYGEYDNSL